jgi:cellulose synthase/poly-beta-1,6-N-acetylglucosamine synthase-like glycosyltransferase
MNFFITKWKIDGMDILVILMCSLLTVMISAAISPYNQSINIITSADAQLLPPPSISTLNEHHITDKESAVRNDSRQLPPVLEPPSIEILTKVLREGKNVIRINVSSVAEIDYCSISFLKGSTKKTVDCVEDRGSIYKGLVEAKPPYQPIEINARDVYGDSTFSVERIDVVPREPILNQVWNMINGLFSAVHSPFF